MRFLILGRSVGLKKENETKITRSLRIRGLVPKHHWCGAWNQQINMAEKLVDAKLSRQRGRKDQPPNLP